MKNGELEMKLKNVLKSFVDIILIVFLVILSIKKGGFYKTDSLTFNLVVTVIGLVYITAYYLYNILKKYIKKKEGYLQNKIDLIEVMLFLLSLSYMLPIVFNNYSNLSDSIFEMIRYLNIYIIYFIVKRSDNKKVYIFSILLITLILCLLGIDGLANRYLLKILESIESGYLTTSNLSRMSSTLQYANVFSLLCILSCIYLVDYLKRKKINVESSDGIKIEYSIIFLLIFIYSSSIILSQSRIILAIFLIYVIYVLLSKKSNNKLYIFITLILSLAYSNIFMNVLQINKTYTYILAIISYLLIFTINFIFIKFIDKNYLKNILEYIKKSINKISFINKLNVLSGSKKNNKILRNLLVFSILILYIILLFTVKVPINLNSNANNNSVSRNIYDLDKNKPNKIMVKINPEVEDTRYNVRFLVVDNELETKEIKSFGYYSNTTNTFEIEYTPDNNFKYLIVNIICEKEKLKVTEILANNDKNYIDYLLFPSEILYRIKDLANGDTSFTQRVYYTKDAMKIITSSLKNTLFGTGGEGFKNTYELVKENNYSSTEVHNVYLQIFVESGAIGFILFFTIVFFSIKNNKNNIIKLLLVIIYVTSIFDLNFSYMLIMCIFAILLGMLNGKDIEDLKKDQTINKNSNTLLFTKLAMYNLYYIFVICFNVVVCLVLIKASFAYYMKVPKIPDDNIPLNEIIKSIEVKKKRILLDKSENVYILSLLEDYDKYIGIRESDDYLSEYDKNILLDMEQKLSDAKNNDRFNANISLKSIKYFKENMTKLIDIKFSENRELGFEHYLNVILSNIEELNRFKFDNSVNNISKEEYINLYTYLLNLNLKENSRNINEYINMLKLKVM